MHKISRILVVQHCIAGKLVYSFTAKMFFCGSAPRQYSLKSCTSSSFFCHATTLINPGDSSSDPQYMVQALLTSPLKWKHTSRTALSLSTPEIWMFGKTSRSYTLYDHVPCGGVNDIPFALEVSKTTHG